MTFSAAVEGDILAHFLEGVSHPTWPTLDMYLLEAYPGTYLQPADAPGYGPLNLDADVWGFASGGMIYNMVSIEFPPATGDWTAPVGGWVLTIHGEPLTSVIMAGTVQSVYLVEGQYVVFSVGQCGVIQNGREPTITGHFTNYAEDKILNHMFDRGNYPTPNIWLGLLEFDPGEMGDYIGSEVPDWLGNGYERIYIPPTSWDLPGGHPQGRWNAAPIIFPIATADWGVVRYFALFDAPTFGNILIYGHLGYVVGDWEVVPQEYNIKAGAQYFIDDTACAIWFSV